MSSKRFQLLAVSTLLACVGAFVAVSVRREPAPPPAPGAAMPGLADNINNVSSITITRNSGSVTLAREGTGDQARWTVPAKSGFPADITRIRTTLLQLKDFQLAEPKTSSPELFPKLGVQDVRVVPKETPKADAPDAKVASAEGAPGALVELKDAAGKQVGALIIGNSAEIGNATLDRPMETGQFVRRPGTMQSWLSKGTVYLDADPMSWLDRKVVGLERDRVKSATVRRLVGTGPESQGEPGKPDLVVTRKSRDEANFESDPIPPDRTLKPNEAVDQPVVAIAFLNMEDVMKDPGGVIGNPDPSATGENSARPAIAQFATFDGMLLTVRTGFRDGKWWASLNAEATGDPLPSPTAVDSKSDAEKAADAKAKADEVAKVAAVAKEVAEINSRSKGWLFAISQFDAKRLSAKFDELIAPVPPPNPKAPKVGPAAVIPPNPESGTPLPARPEEPVEFPTPPQPPK